MDDNKPKNINIFLTYWFLRFFHLFLKGTVSRELWLFFSNISFPFTICLIVAFSSFWTFFPQTCSVMEKGYCIGFNDNKLVAVVWSIPGKFGRFCRWPYNCWGKSVFNNKLWKHTSSQWYIYVHINFTYSNIVPFVANVFANFLQQNYDSVIVKDWSMEKNLKEKSCDTVLLNPR